MQIVIARDAGKVLVRMQPAKAKDIREAIDKVAADPTAPSNNRRTLKAVPSGFRIRVGANFGSSWRVSYTLDPPGRRYEGFRNRLERRSIPMSDPLRLRPLGEHAALVRDRLAALAGGELVDDRAELVVMTPKDLAELT